MTVRTRTSYILPTLHPTIDHLEPLERFGLHARFAVFFNKDDSRLFEKSLLGRGCAVVSTGSVGASVVRTASITWYAFRTMFLAEIMI